MIPLVPPQSLLTVGSATTDLQRGLQALGLAAPALSPQWAVDNPTQAGYDAAALTILLDRPCAAFLGVAAWHPDGGPWSDVAGAALPGPLFVLEMLPEAVRRLQIEIDLLTATNVYPVPVAMVLRDIAAPAPLPPPMTYLACETLIDAGIATVSFHDARGLPIDPIALAYLWDVLLRLRPGLQNTAVPVARTNAGGLMSFLGLASGDLCHVVDPHGWTYAGHGPGTQLRVLDAAGNRLRDVSAGGLETLAPGETLGRTAADLNADPPGTTPMTWGHARNGLLGTAALALPPVPPPQGNLTLDRRFFRIMAVDLAWHLLGNRTTAPVQIGTDRAVPGGDGGTPAFLQPVVRNAVPNFAWFTDGLDVLGAITAMTGVFGNPNDQPFAIAVSPTLDATLACPPGPGPAAHWPQFPPPPAGAGEIDARADITAGMTARWRPPADGPGAGQDVVLTLDGTRLPLGAHVRAYPRRFVEVGSLDDGPSFVRGDGGAAIAVAGPVSLLLPNPFALATAEPHPATPELVLDFVVVSRSGQRRMLSSVRITVADPPQPHVAPPPAGTAVFAPGTLVAAMLDGFRTRAIAPCRLFGIPGTAPAGPPPQNIVDLMRRLASDDQPRQAPRLPTQARFDTVVAMGLAPGGVGFYNWQAVLSGIRLDRESHQAQPDLGNPGQPATPDVFTAGIACAGQLAYDIAIHGLKRSQPIFFPTGVNSFRGWIATVMDNKWGLPANPPGGTVAAALLETVAAFADTPELGTAPAPEPGATVNGLVARIAGLLGVPPPNVGLPNEPRLVREVQREIVAARSGLRDTLWSLTRALAEAREFIYIEGPAFARTAWPSDPPRAHEIDLAALLLDRLSRNPRLKLMVCVARRGDFAADRPHWSATALAQRDEALVSVLQPHAERAVAFHPVGYPGRDPAIRTTTVIVDDVYCLCGTSHFRRRGMTFDGGADVAHMDQQMQEQRSAGIAAFRQRLIATRLGLAVPATPAAGAPLWHRLANGESAFRALSELVAAGGAGRLHPVTARKVPDTLIPQAGNLVDPDGADASALFGLFAALLLEG